MPFWQVTDREDRVSIFGRSEDARIADPSAPRRIGRWLLEETVDSHGNRTLYRYKRENAESLPPRISDAGHELRANLYLERILYGNWTDGQGEERFAFEVRFDYGEYDLDPPAPLPTRSWPAREDCFSSFRPGFEVRTCRLCRNVLLWHHFPAELGTEPCLVAATRLRYDESPVLSRLREVQRVGYRRRADGSYLEQAMAPLELTYTGFDPQQQSFQPLVVRSEGPLPAGPGQTGSQMVDLYGDGLPGLLAQQGDVLSYWRPQGGAVSTRPSRFPLLRSRPASESPATP